MAYSGAQNKLNYIAAITPERYPAQVNYSHAADTKLRPTITLTIDTQIVVTRCLFFITCQAQRAADSIAQRREMLIPTGIHGAQ